MTFVPKEDCRACNRESDQFKHLLEKTIIDDEVKTFDALLSYCTTLECFVENHESGMPQHICNSCVEHLLQSYLFKKMVLRNERAYRERLESQEKSKKDKMVVSVKEEQVLKEEIDIEDTEEFISENEEIVEGNNVEPDFVDEFSIDNEENSNIVVTNEADADSDGRKYNSRDNCDKDGDNGDEDDDVICVEEQLEKNSNKNKAKRKYTTRNYLSKADLVCQYCGKVFNEMNLLRDHSCLQAGKNQHCDEIRYKCYLCGLLFRTSSILRAHESTCNEKTYACELCDKKFHTAEQQKLHSTIHIGQPTSSCGTCGKSFQDNSSLKAHMITHKGEKSSQIEDREKDSTQMSGYTQHMLFLHANEYPYKCDVCGRPFLTYKSLSSHKHSNHCSICDRILSNRTALKRHMLMHERKDIGSIKTPQATTRRRNC